MAAVAVLIDGGGGVCRDGDDSGLRVEMPPPDTPVCVCVFFCHLACGGRGSGGGKGGWGRGGVDIIVCVMEAMGLTR